MNDFLVDFAVLGALRHLFGGFLPVFLGLFQGLEAADDEVDALFVLGADLSFRVFFVVAVIVAIIIVVVVGAVVLFVLEAFEELFDPAFAVDQRLFVVENEIDQVGDGTDRIDDDAFAEFDLFGDLDLLFLGQQGDLPHLAQVHPHRGVGARPLHEFMLFEDVELFVARGFDHLALRVAAGFGLLLVHQLGVF